MITKLIIFGLLCSSDIQAFPSPDKESKEEEEGSPSTNSIHQDAETLPSPDRVPQEQQLPCDQQIGWIKNTTLGTKKQYDDYYAQLKAHNVTVKDFGYIKTQHDKINQLISDSFKKYNADLEKLRTIKSDAKAQWDICIKELKEFSFMSQNLSALTISIKPKILDFARQLGLPPGVVDDLDHTLGGIVNFMFIIDMGKNTFRDLHSMVKEADVKATEGIKLEEKYRFTEEGVEANGKLEEREMIGRVEEPAVPSNVNTPQDDKELNDLINPEKIETADHELEERERLERIECERIERIKFRPEVIHVGK